MSLSRRDLLSRASALGAGVAITGSAASLFTATPATAANPVTPGYGPLVPDPDGLLTLPRGFKYKVVSRAGDPLSGGGHGRELRRRRYAVGYLADL